MSHSRRLSGFSLSAQLYLAAALVVVGFVLFGGWAFMTIEKVKVGGYYYQGIVRGKDLVADILPPPNYIIESYLTSQLLNGFTPESERRQALDKLRALRDEYDQRHSFWLTEPLSDQIKARFLKDAHEPAQAFFEVQEKEFIPAILAGDQAATDAALHKLDALYRKHRGAVDDVVRMATAENADFEQRAEAVLRQGIVGLAAVMAAVIAACVILLVVLARGFKRELGRACAVMDTIAQGRLDSEITTQRADEIGKLMVAAGTMQQGLRELVAGVNGDAERIATSATQLDDASRTVARSTEEQNDASAAMAASVEQLSVSIAHMAESAGASSTLARETGECSVGGRQAMVATASEVAGLADVVNKAASNIEELAESSRQISDIVAVIKDIADQTNLLALNAAIEAARAGEQGRGFAVVADEVRKLAERTTQSTHEIAHKIESIQARTKEAVGEIQGGAERSQAAVQRVEEAAQAMQEIAGRTQQLVSEIATISDALGEQRSASAGIAQHVERVLAMSNSNGAAVDEVAQTAENLSRMVADLETRIGRFQL